MSGELQSWKKLMEEKGKQKENQFKLEVQLQKEKLEFKKEQFYFKEKRGPRQKGRIKDSPKKGRIAGRFMKTLRGVEFVN